MKLPFSLEVGLGYGKYQDMIRDDGDTALARIGIAKQLATMHTLRTGLEIGVQSGNTARLDLPQTTIDALGGLPVDATMKPTVDILLTANVYPRGKNSFFTQIKAGPILRSWQFTRGSINNLTKVNPELQLGIGMDINRLTSIALLYQGIFGNDPDFKIASDNCSAHVSNIPSENSIILGLSIHLDQGTM